MAECGVCGRGDQFLFVCEHCRNQFCDEHHSPGAHSCDAAPIMTAVHPDTSQSSTSGAATKTGSSLPSRSSVADRLRSQKLIPSATVLGLLIGAIFIGAVAGFALTELRPMGQGPGELLEDANPLAGGDTPAASAINETSVERRVTGRTNELRRSAGVQPAEYAPALAEIAQYHSRDMADRNYTGHVAPDGETVSDRFERFGYTCQAPSELVLRTELGRTIETANGSLRFTTNRELAAGILELWQQSEAHRKALLTPSWRRVGVGVVVTESDRVYVTLNAC